MVGALLKTLSISLFFSILILLNPIPTMAFPRPPRV
jgi:hypothetical protein